MVDRMVIIIENSFLAGLPTAGLQSYYEVALLSAG